MNIDELAAKAAQVADRHFTTEVPERAQTNTAEAEKVIVALLERADGKHISGKNLNDALETVGLRQKFIGNLLFAMKNKRAISCSGPSSYCKYHPQYDGNRTASRIRKEQENGESQSEQPSSEDEYDEND